MPYIYLGKALHYIYISCMYTFFIKTCIFLKEILISDTEVQHQSNSYFWSKYNNSLICIWKRSAGRFLSSHMKFSMHWCHSPYTQYLFTSHRAHLKNTAVFICNIYRVLVRNQKESRENFEFEHRLVFCAVNLSAYQRL